MTDMIEMKPITAGTTKQFLEDINSNFDNIEQEFANKQNKLEDSQIRNILFGFNEPDPTIGQNGDVYIQIEE